MTLDELSASLPNGFHDAKVYTIELDFASRVARLSLDVWVGDLDAPDHSRREAYRKAELTLSGLVFWVSEPPDPAYPYLEKDCITIDTGPMHALSEPASIKLPPVPDGAFVNWMFVGEWNAFIYVAAMDAQIAWRTH